MHFSFHQMIQGFKIAFENCTQQFVMNTKWYCWEKLSVLRELREAYFYTYVPPKKALYLRKKERQLFVVLFLSIPITESYVVSGV